MRESRTYALGTRLDVTYPWGLHTGGRALCSDGRTRELKRIAQTADTFFSVPAAVRVNGRTVTGFVTVETLVGWSTETDEDPYVVRFVANRYGRNGHLLPDWPPTGERAPRRYVVWYASAGCLPDSDEPEFEGTLEECERYVRDQRRERDSSDPDYRPTHELYDWTIDELEDGAL